MSTAEADQRGQAGADGERLRTPAAACPANDHREMQALVSYRWVACLAGSA